MWNIIIGVVVILLILGLFAVGYTLITGSFQPIKDEAGNPVPLTKTEKAMTAGILFAIGLGIIALFIGSDHPWVRKFKNRS